MIIKCVRGDYFPGLIDYIMRWGQYAASGEIPRVLEHRGIFHPKTAAAQLWDQASLAPGRTRRAVHLIARAEQGLTDAQYCDLGQRMLAAGGLEERPYVLVLHDDDGHLHLATVEVDENGAPPPRRHVSRSLKREVDKDEAKELPAGDVISRSWDSHLAWRLTKVSRQVEILYGLRQLGRARDSFDKIRIPTWQLKKENEEGLIPLAKGLGKEIQTALDLPTWNERSEALAEHGLGLRPYAGPNKKRQGLQIYAVGEPTHFCNASDLGKKYGLGSLEKKSDGPFREWYDNHHPPAERQGAGVAFRIPGKLQSDQHLVRLKVEYDELIRSQREQRAERKGMLQRHKIERQKDNSIVRLLKERLVATGNVSKTWIRTLCQIARAVVQAKTRARHIIELATANTLTKRQLKWPEFLASKAASDPGACRIFDQVRQNLSIEERLREIEDAKAAEEDRSRALQDAKAAAAREQARVDDALAAAQIQLSRKAAAAKRRRIRDTSELVGSCSVRMRSLEDREPLLSYLEERGDRDSIDAFVDPEHREYVEDWFKRAIANQKHYFGKYLCYIDSAGSSAFTKDGRIDHLQIEDIELRRISYLTHAWPEAKAAARERLAQLKIWRQQARSGAISAPSSEVKMPADSTDAAKGLVRENPEAPPARSTPPDLSKPAETRVQPAEVSLPVAESSAAPPVIKTPPPRFAPKVEQETIPARRSESAKSAPITIENVTDGRQQLGQRSDRDDEKSEADKSAAQNDRQTTQSPAPDRETAVVSATTRSSRKAAFNRRRKPKPPSAAMVKARELAKQRAEANSSAVGDEVAVNYAAGDTMREAPPNQEPHNRESLAGASTAESDSPESRGTHQAPRDVETDGPNDQAPAEGSEVTPEDDDAHNLHLQWAYTQRGGKSPI